jgi:hypothetical protein
VIEARTTRRRPDRRSHDTRFARTVRALPACIGARRRPGLSFWAHDALVRSAKAAAIRLRAPTETAAPSRMELDSGSVTAALHGCRSAVGADCEPADAWSSSKASAAIAPRTRSLLHECRRRLRAARRRRRIPSVIATTTPWPTRPRSTWFRLRRGTRPETPPRMHHGPRPDAGCRSRACPGEGIPGRAQTSVAVGMPIGSSDPLAVGCSNGPVTSARHHGAPD